MLKTAPLYPLNFLQSSEDRGVNVFFLNQNIQRKNTLMDAPYRGSYFGVGLCLKGEAQIRVNLETYTIEPNCLLANPPHTTKQWLSMSEDFESLILFFDRNFIIDRNSPNLEQFSFFGSTARHAIKVAPADATEIAYALATLHNCYAQERPYQKEILKSLINALLYRFASLYELTPELEEVPSSRAQQISKGFKTLLNNQFGAQRSLKFYAEQLFVTPKHLTETIKEVTRKTAGQWIAEATVLEAKVLLQRENYSVAQIADQLRFPDQSTFGKFFKKMTGCAPSAYRQLL